MEILVLHSIGDILFCEPIYRHFWVKDGVKPRVIIRDHLLYLQEYIESADFVGASKWSGDIDDMTVRDGYLPLRFANQIVRGLAADDHHDFENTMPDKYVLAGLPVEMWKGMKIKFNWHKFYELEEVLGISPAEKLILTNRFSQAGEIDIRIKSDCRIIEMHTISGFNVLDWALIMAYAQENHHVSTSTFYVQQAALNGMWERGGETFRLLGHPEYLKNKFYIYPRPNEDGLKGISKLVPDFDLVRVDPTPGPSPKERGDGA